MFFFWYLVTEVNRNTKKKKSRLQKQWSVLNTSSGPFTIHKVNVNHSEIPIQDHDDLRKQLPSFYQLHGGRHVLQDHSSGQLVGVAEFIRYDDMTSEQFNLLQQIQQHLMLMRTFHYDCKTNGAHQAAGGNGVFSQVGWRKAMIFGEVLGMWQF